MQKNDTNCLRNTKTDSSVPERKPWPRDCKWSEPLHFADAPYRDADEADLTLLDEEGEDLLAVRAYFDHLVECGRLNEDYTWNDEYDGEGSEFKGFDEDNLTAETFIPDFGEEYWTDRFEFDLWEEDMSDHINMLKLDYESTDTIIKLQSILDYQFVNENLLRQAFTRRAFAIEHGLSGDSEQLEFLGDSVLNLIVTREIIDNMTEVDLQQTDAPFATEYNEGDFTKIRRSFVCKEYLATKAAETGLDQYILYGSGETPGESSREDMMEALIGAVTIDSGWDLEIVSALADRLLSVQLSDPDRYLKQSYYELFNAWHMRHFGELPDYTVDGRGPFSCIIRFTVPENDLGVWRRQILDSRGDTRSHARELAAEFAYHFVVGKGLWISIKESGIKPSLEDSINQLQELYQKKYLDELPEYIFEEGLQDNWFCDCVCCGIKGWGKGKNKIQAKKQAAYMVLSKLFTKNNAISDVH